MYDQFINRVDDFSWFSKKLNTKNTLNKLFMVKGKTGIGKSSFTDKLIEQQFKNYHSISIRFSSSRNAGFADGYFLQHIASKINDSAKNSKNICSFNRYLLNTKFVTETIRHYFLNVNGVLDNMLAYGLNDKVVQAFSEYIQLILTKNSIVLNIESIETIDDYSMKVLKRVINETEGNVFLLEYTLKQDNDPFWYKLWDSLSRSNKGESYKYLLKNLPLDECLSIISSQNEITPEDISLVEKVYWNSSGNLYKIIHFSPDDASLIEAYEELNYDTTKMKLNHLSHLEKYCLIIVELHACEMEQSLLEVILTDSIFGLDFDAIEIIDGLVQKNIIYRIRTKIAIHDSLANLIKESHDYFSHYFLSYRATMNVYSNLKIDENINYLDNYGITLKEILLNEITMHERFDINELYLLMDEIEIFNEGNYARDIIKLYLECLMRSRKRFTKIRMMDKVDMYIIEQSYNLGIFNNVKTICEQSKSISNQTIKIYYALSLGNLGYYSESEAILEDLSLSQVNTNKSRLRLLIDLIRQINYLTYESRKRAVIFSQSILSKKEYSDFPEYGIVLRNYATRVNHCESIEILKESIQHFKRFGLQLDVAQTMITLSTRYAYTDSLNLACDTLLLAEKMLSTYNYRTYFILNNRAVLDIMMNECSFRTENMLKSALQNVQDEYERIIILSNLISCYCTMECYKKAEVYFLQLLEENFRNYKSEDFLYLVYNTLIEYSRLSKSNGNLSKYQEEGLNKLIPNNIPKNEFQKMVKSKFDGELFPSLRKDDPYFVEKKYRFDPGFITYWGFNISDGIESW